jgi:PAS domain S-box-containing protein
MSIRGFMPIRHYRYPDGANRFVQRVVGEFGKSWVNLVGKPDYSSLQSLQEYILQATLTMMIAIIGGCTLFVTIGVLLDIFDIFPLIIMVIILSALLIAILAIRSERWNRIAYIIPVVLLFLLGMYGNFENGVFTTLNLFYFMALVLTVVFSQNTLVILGVWIMSTLVPITIGMNVVSLLIEEVVAFVITFLGIGGGLSGLVWFFVHQMQQANGHALQYAASLQEALAALQDSESRARSVIESIPIGMHIYQKNNNGISVLHSANPAADKILGVRHNDLYGKKVEDTFPGLGEMHILQTYQQVLETGEPWQSELLYRYGSVSAAFDVHMFKLSQDSVAAAFLDISERKRNEEEQRLIHTLALDMRRASTRTEIIHILLNHTVMSVNACGACLFSKEKDRDGIFLEASLPASEMKNVHLNIDISSIGQPEILRPQDLRPLYTIIYNLLNLPYMSCMPLVASGYQIGLLCVGCSSDFDDRELRLLESMAEMAAAALHRTSLFKDLERSQQELAIAYEATLEGWAKTLELRHRETEGHSRSVVEWAVRLGTQIGLADDELANLRRGALLHDIGKIGIPDSILEKKGPLTTDEFEVIKAHPLLARDVLERIPFLQVALDIPLYHHEKWDGSGYPFGLHGEEIPLPARIFAVIDVWDALSHDRVYRLAWPDWRVIAYLREQAGKHFDPNIIDEFLRLIEKEIK